MTTRKLAGDLLGLFALWTILPAAASSPRQLFNIADYGAVRDGSALATVVEDIRFDNWTMKNVGVAIGTVRTPTFRNIAVDGVTISGAKKVIDIDGLPEMPIAGLRLTDVIGSGKLGLTARYTDAWELHHVQVNAGRGPAFAIEGASNLELDGVTTRQPIAGSPVVRLTQTPGAVLRNSRAFPGTGTFLSVAPAKLESLHLEGNVLDNAAIPTEER